MAWTDAWRTAWATFAAQGSPSTDSVPWPAFNNASQALSFLSPSAQGQSNLAAAHHCDFWAAG
jgi:carboxylesterase type B